MKSQIFKKALVSVLFLVSAESFAQQLVHFDSFSILGDSYSTFKGYNMETNAENWFPQSSSFNNVQNVGEMWWQLFADEYGSTLVENNSWSGSCVCYDSYGAGKTDGKDMSFVTRCRKFSKSTSLIIVEGGTNDSFGNVSLGEYKYSDFSESDFETFRPALAYILDYITHQIPNAKIVFMLNSDLLNGIDESVITICKHYDVPVLELAGISKSLMHPNIEGMKEIKNQLITFLNSLTTSDIKPNSILQDDEVVLYTIDGTLVYKGPLKNLKVKKGTYILQSRNRRMIVFY